MNAYRIAAVALLGALLVAFAGVGRPETARSAEEEPDSGITVTGVGSVKTVPDRAELSFGVHTEDETAKSALAANSARMREIVNALRKAGIARQDMQTEYVSVSPRHADDGRSVIGYSADNSVRVEAAMERAGAVIDAAVSAGANHVSGPSLSRSNREQLYRQALEAAIAEARDKAETIADAAGVSVGRVTKVVESAEPSEPPIYTYADAARTPTPVQPGTEEIEATLAVTFEVSYY